MKEDIHKQETDSENYFSQNTSISAKTESRPANHCGDDCECSEENKISKTEQIIKQQAREAFDEIRLETIREIEEIINSFDRVKCPHLNQLKEKLEEMNKQWN